MKGLKFKYKNNIYKYKNDKFYILGGEYNLAVFEVTDEKMVDILKDELEKIGEGE